jgi:hypothetical protein
VHSVLLDLITSAAHSLVVCVYGFADEDLAAGWAMRGKGPSRGPW